MNEPVARADSYNATVTIDTSSLVGSSSAPFYFGVVLVNASLNVDGNNSASVTNLNFGGGSAGAFLTSTGGTSATGNLTSGITLTDTDPSDLNYFAAGFTPGSTLSFDFSMTTNADANLNSALGLTGDQFEMVIFDNTEMAIPTTDQVLGMPGFLVATVCPACPNGISVQSYNIPDAGATSVVPSATATPEPATLLLLGPSLLGLEGVSSMRTC
jgi:hypothetical protein